MSTNFDHLVAFVSNQAVDAVSVLFDQRFRVSRVTLIGLKRDMQHVPSIGNVIEQRLGVEVADYTLPSPHIPGDYCDDLENLLRRLSSTDRVAVNLNTDDAVCACLALQAAARVDIPVFAIETQYDRLIWLSAAERAMPSLDIADVVGCIDMFHFQGYEYVQTKPLRDYAGKLTCALGLTPLVIRDESLLHRFLPKTGLTPRPISGASTLIDLLKNSGLLVPNLAGRLQFSGEEAVAFLRGAWLELAVYDALARLAKGAGVVDSHRGFCVRHKSGLVCEFDIVFMLRNELHIVECKSGESRGGKFLTHFEGITRAHGLRARTMLVSVDRLSETLVATAKGMNIALIHGHQLGELSPRLAKWMRG